VDLSLSHQWLHHAELALRLLVGVALGGLIGWERTQENRHFGLRIHMLMALAAAGFSVLAFEAADWAALQKIEADPFRILQAIIAGLALLAAGTIIKGDGEVKGLTTGVSLWMAGVIGVTAGAGMFILSTLIAALAFAILYGLRRRPT
jgi:putative Mg2+ transporter-C (MgtC) family protein